ncbi:chemotaxis protein CheW [Desulfatirhabdium butyrativorans]|jgi:purine-binding chemotaxis protein CheW|uniref:chemotaxis protein CheW n=1 Tax=Desulfatirhabdium butyrativorans TaxID=340467 RepID=UPI00041570CC|nr:chemotaxis protein CheW [Desulfatirhabdium butyrativorans]
MSISGIAESAQYLTFKLEEEVFAVDVANVREILDFTPATKVPGTPEFMRGVINVRGNVVPIVDMRLKFGLSKTEKTVDTCIVVMEISVDDDKIVLGALVDSVQEVFEMEASQIEPPPRMGTRWKTEFIKGIGKRNDQLIIILDIDRVFSSNELSLLQDSAERIG